MAFDCTDLTASDNILGAVVPIRELWDVFRSPCIAVDEHLRPVYDLLTVTDF